MSIRRAYGAADATWWSCGIWRRETTSYKKCKIQFIRIIYPNPLQAGLSDTSGGTSVGGSDVTGLYTRPSRITGLQCFSGSSVFCFYRAVHTGVTIFSCELANIFYHITYLCLRNFKVGSLSIVKTFYRVRFYHAMHAVQSVVRTFKENKRR